MANQKVPTVDSQDELLFTLAEALAKQLPRRKRARFVRDWLEIAASLEGAAVPISDGRTEAARKIAAAKVRERTPTLLQRLVE